MSPRRIVGDLSRLPPVGSGSHSGWYWATLGFMMIEGMGFALALGAYVFLMGGASAWPIRSPPPDLWAGTLQTAVLLVSVIPAVILMRRAKAQDLAQTRLWAVIVAAFNIACLAVRAIEFAHLNTRWDLNAYGSITWALILLHTTHLVTDALGTVMMTVFLFTHPVGPERFSDVTDDCVYWVFVAVTWLPIYFAIYWAPRLV
jgi:heme/copper-type cytochrome/quinol oxidase subunit 3